MHLPLVLTIVAIVLESDGVSMLSCGATVLALSDGVASASAVVPVLDGVAIALVLADVTSVLAALVLGDDATSASVLKGINASVSVASGKSPL